MSFDFVVISTLCIKTTKYNTCSLEIPDHFMKLSQMLALKFSLLLFTDLSFHSIFYTCNFIILLFYYFIVTLHFPCVCYDTEHSV